MNPNDLISQATAARLRGVDRAAIADLIKRGRLRTASIDGVPYVYRSEVLSFERQKPGPKPKISKAGARTKPRLKV
jgi:hypothetical protein